MHRTKAPLHCVCISDIQRNPASKDCRRTQYGSQPLYCAAQLRSPQITAENPDCIHESCKIQTQVALSLTLSDFRNTFDLTFGDQRLRESSFRNLTPLEWARLLFPISRPAKSGLKADGEQSRRHNRAHVFLRRSSGVQRCV
ncbi:hypothetical protein BaRGS_00003717 [Batillaria attramentaria]|uniref:Uncharacterized protein n=1 Tax=Batillaria attramentaria TaxID=370345 RepID=A0ABD0M0I8_9CAEN